MRFINLQQITINVKMKSNENESIENEKKKHNNKMKKIPNIFFTI